MRGGSTRDLFHRIFCFGLDCVSFLIIPDAHLTFFLASGELTSPRLSGLFSNVFH